MTESTMFNIVKKIFNRDEINHLAESLVIKNGVGYELYNKYRITKSNDRFYVQKFSYHTTKSFYSLRNAVIWSTMDKKNYILDAEDIVRLDMKLEGLDTNIQNYKHLCEKSKNYEAKIVYYAKLNEDKIKRKTVTEKIESYSQQVKIWQNKMYDQAVK
jgi:hypothetical protein